MSMILSAYPLKCLSLTIPILGSELEGPAEVAPADDTIAMSYATKISTLSYFQFSVPGQQPCWWRVTSTTSTSTEAEQQDFGLETRVVRKIDKEDGSNASNYFDWEWEADG
jgi:hypothetical protein